MRSMASHERSADPALWAAFQVSVVSLGSTAPGPSAAPASATPRAAP
jgi:hypothetical protein